MPIYHVDLYRLDSPGQVIGAGLEEYLPSTNGVTLVEWVERWLPVPNLTSASWPTRQSYPPRLWVVRFELVSPQERQITDEVVSH